MRLETDRLVLRLPRPDDAVAAGELLADAEVMRFIGGQVVLRSGWEAVVEMWLARWEANGMGPFVIESRTDGRFLGRTGIMVWDTRTWTHATLESAGEFAQPELGWALRRAEWGNGFVTEAAGAAREWARTERSIGDLVSVIAPANVRSQRVAERLGAVPAETVTLFDMGDAVVWRYPGG